MDEQRKSSRKTRVGKVVSDKMDKTVVVAVSDRVAHKRYKKIIGRTYRLKAHDEKNECSNGDTVRDYYWHSVSHHLGLETHDVSLLDEPLRAGNVITDEPGLYLEKEGIGVRIEDDIMITENGCINLSREIMKEVEDIEAFMAER